MFLSYAGTKQSFLHFMFLLSDRGRTFHLRGKDLCRLEHILYTCTSNENLFAGKYNGDEYMLPKKMHDHLFLTRTHKYLNIHSAFQTQNTTKTVPLNSPETSAHPVTIWCHNTFKFVVNRLQQHIPIGPSDLTWGKAFVKLLGIEIVKQPPSTTWCI